MSLVLNVDGPRWRDHLSAVAAANPGIVPVAKGNGYGFTLGRLARKTRWIRDRGHEVGALAAGTYDEVPELEQRWDGDLLVLTPWRPWVPLQNRNLIHTVSRLEDLERLLALEPRARFVLERMTSMRRHGMSASELWAAGELLRKHPGARAEGLALHMPLAAGGHYGEVERLVNDYVGASVPGERAATIWVSHLTTGELGRLRQEYADFTVRPRIGTALWLGDRGALRVTATVLDVHPIDRGEPYGYRGRSAPRSGHLLVVSGGTAHGIGLEAPVGDHSLRSRANSIARGGMDAAGFVRSPYTVGGKVRLFAEPPHMQASMLFLPTGAPVPSVGDAVDVRVRHTATTFDEVVID
ncbi:MAG: alanine racemase [Nocardioidaceae bacterium]|nr:alanine racemase [Nocardioidaceae bacterium]MCL2612749.1 alanine racemase [Nocardioidaceae bacterium]